MTDYVVVLGADADARFIPDDPPPQLLQVPTPVGPVDVTFRTRFADEGYESPVPREMWIDVRGAAEAGLPEVISAYGNAASAVLPAIAVATNAWIGDLYPKIAYAAGPPSGARPFFQAFNREEAHTVPRPGRWVDAEATVNLVASSASHPKTGRLHRAMSQYALALGHWRFGHETLAVAHLFMASEALTPLFVNDELGRLGLDREGLADAWGVESRHLDSEARKRLIFRMDESTFADAKKASDGFEHSFLDLAEVRTLSADVRDTAARYLREAILAQSGLDEPYRSRLLASPFDVPLRSHLTKYLWGEFVGDAVDLALPEFEYPHFEWTSRLKAFSRDGKIMTFTPEETPTARFSAGVQLANFRFEGWTADGVKIISTQTDPLEITRADGSIETVDPDS